MQVGSGGETGLRFLLQAGIERIVADDGELAWN